MKFKLILVTVLLAASVQKASALIIDGYGNPIEVAPIAPQDDLFGFLQQAVQRDWQDYQRDYQQERRSDPQFRQFPGLAGEFVDELDHNFSLIDFLFGAR
jgi:hypothetical protein